MAIQFDPGHGTGNGFSTGVDPSHQSQIGVFSLHWYGSKRDQPHLLPNTPPDGKRVREQVQERRKALQVWLVEEPQTA